jgi:exopolyphosphatase/guanosine-5'-triphosphate,3'-diphosphate pyrophosphatase
MSGAAQPPAQARPSELDERVESRAYAALDLGTNNCRLLVARPTGNSFRVVDAFSRIIRLGEGVTASRRISEPAIERAIGALTICRNKMKNKGVTRARLIATEACRSAENSEDFRARVAQDVGLELEVIDRETEARLAATGCTTLIDLQAEGAVLFDIGGGSSELVRLDRSQQSRGGPPLPQIRGWISLPHGVVTLAERYGGQTVSTAAYAAMVDDVSAMIEPFAREYAGAGLRGVHMLGTSGTVTTIAGVHLNLQRYDRNRVDGCWMNEQQITAVIDKLLAMNYQERAASPCIGPERADLVLAGCAILDAIRRAFPCPRLRVADRGLREGMLVQMMRDDGVWDGASQPAAS